MGVRIFDHKKQYACTEVFRLEELQVLATELEDSGENESPIYFEDGRQLQKDMVAAAATIREFITNLQEQEKKQ